MKDSKFAINRVARICIMSTAIVGMVMLLGASSLIKNTRQNTEPPKTELMSKEASEALKLNSLQQTQQSVPTVHNYNLDATLMKFAENSDELIDFNKFINEIYTNNGSYLGSAVLQKEIDMQMLSALIKKNTNLIIKNNINPQLGKKIEGFGEPFYKTITPNAELIDKWLDNYSQVIDKNLQFDHKPTAKEVSDRLDFIAENKMNFTQDEIIEYYIYCEDFLSRIKDKNSEQAFSNLLAFQMFMIDRLAFAKELYGVGVFGRGSYQNNGKIMRDFYKEWMESVEPEAN